MIIVYVETLAGDIPKASRAAITAAREIGAKHGEGPVKGIVLGGDQASEAAAALKDCGLDAVLYLADESLEPYLGVRHAQALKAVFEEYEPSVFVAPATTRGKDLCPRVAALLGAGQASDVISVEEDGGFKRPMYAGNVIASVSIETEKKVVSVRATAFDPVDIGEGECSVTELSTAVSAVPGTEFVAFDTVQSERPELTEADAVVSGGRALKSEENFEQYLLPLADALGAAVGASRAAVDSGYAPNDWQVGQTGKVVAPNLYVAIGISGAIQHIAGMKDSKTIVAINKDPEAPIFEIADYGLVADLYQAVPELVEEIQKAKQQS